MGSKLSNSICNCDTVLPTHRNLMSKKGSSDVFVSVALGSRDRSFSIWSTDLKRPLIVINDVFDQSVLDLSWSRDGKVGKYQNTLEDLCFLGSCLQCIDQGC